MTTEVCKNKSNEARDGTYNAQKRELSTYLKKNTGKTVHDYIDSLGKEYGDEVKKGWKREFDLEAENKQQEQADLVLNITNLILKEKEKECNP